LKFKFRLELRQR